MELDNGKSRNDRLLPEGVSISASVFEIDRYPDLKNKFQNIIGRQLTHKMFGDVSQLDSYETEYSIDEDDTRVWITERWVENGLSYERHGSTGGHYSLADESYLHIHSLDIETSKRNDLVLRFDTSDGNLNRVEIEGSQSIDYWDDNIPFVNQIVEMDWFQNTKQIADSKFDKRGDFKYIKVIFEDQANEGINSSAPTFIFISKYTKVGNGGLRKQHLKFENSMHWYGETTSRKPYIYFEKARMAPVGKKNAPNIDYKI